MASRDSLKDKLAQCKDVEDYLAVAREAMAAPEEEEDVPDVDSVFAKLKDLKRDPQD